MLRDASAAQHVAYALQLALCGVFVASVALKLRRPGAFARNVADYGLLPRSRAVVVAAAATIVAVEALLALAFFVGAILEVAVAVAAFMLLAFGAGIQINLRRGRTIPCGCFGNDAELISGHSLVRIALLLGAVCTLAVLLALPAVHVVTVSDVMDEPEYLIEAGGIAVVLGLAALWSLNARSVAAVADALRNQPS